MPTFSFHRPRFLHFRLSRSPSPTISLLSPAGARDSDAAQPSPSPGPSLDPSRTLSSRDSSGLGVLEPEAGAATGSSHLSTLANPIRSQNTTGYLPVDRPLDDFSGQPSQTSRPVSRVGVVAEHSSYPLPTSPQLSLNSPYLTSYPSQSSGIFSHAHNFTLTNPTFIDGNVTYINPASNKFMEKLLEKTILGAASDSSVRYPPPRCHPGTRLAILERCISFITNCNDEKKMLWVVGAAGVGKSAIMQNVAESPNLPVTSNASVFFSINGRNDGTKLVMTLSYQFAAKSEPYRRVIEDEITRDPSLLQAAMPVQFEKFIIEPFIRNPYLNSAGRVLIIIDGLDECSNSRTQQELLRLICDLCITYPSSPLVWLVASRPETHITSFFSRVEVIPVYEKEEISVDSDEARADVERFLRDGLTEIKNSSEALDPKWPKEQDLWKLANASGGLFAYARTAIRYIGDSNIGDPVSQLSDILRVIDNHPMTDIPREEHPLALLDALYAQVLSCVPSKTMKNTRKLLLALASNWEFNLDENESCFIVLCNWLGMTRDAAYAAINHLRSVLRTPRRDKAHREKLEPFHKSFIDYISDFTRSGFSRDILLEARQFMTKCAFRILKEAPDGINFGDVSYQTVGGILARGPSGAGDKISLAWEADGEVGWNDDEMRLSVYKLAIGEAVAGMGRQDPTFQTPFCVRLLTTRFVNYYPSLRDGLRDLVFDESRRHEFMMHGILKQIPLKAVDIAAMFNEVQLRFRCIATAAPNVSDPWNSSCQHEREGKWEEGRKDVDWMTVFWRDDCTFCHQRFKCQMKSWSTRSPDHIVSIMFTSTGRCCVEVRSVDEEDGMSEWTYWFWYHLPWKKRKKYGSTV